jgi:3',5'-cyclic AMP phosphodiesterase CpdA
MYLYHISDLHVRSNMRNNEVVEKKLCRLEEDMGPEDILVVTGDITDDGKYTQYNVALDLLLPLRQKLLPGRIVVVPGNHDYGAIGNFYSKRCAERFHQLCTQVGGMTQSVCDPLEPGFGIEFLRLDTCLRTGSVVDFAQGRVGWWARQKLKLELARIRQKGWKSVVVMHHSPLCNEWWMRLQDAKQFLGVVLGHADYVLCGHTHGVVKHHYPMGLPENQAQTWIYDAGALHQGKGPHIIMVAR